MKRTITGIVLILLFFSGYSQTLEKIEPPYWLDGFHSKTLILLVYGKDISKTDVAVSGYGIKLERVLTVDNPDNLILDLRFTSDQSPVNFPVTFLLGNNVIAEYLFEIRPGPVSVYERKELRNPVYVTTSPAGMYEIEPAWQADNKYLFLGDTLHRQKRELVFYTGLKIGGGHPWVSHPPVTRWVQSNKTSRTTENFLKSTPLLDQYLIQNALWWISVLNPDAVCVPGDSPADEQYRQMIRSAVEKEYPGLPFPKDCKNQ